VACLIFAVFHAIFTPTCGIINRIGGNLHETGIIKVSFLGLQHKKNGL
jgi:hypothetical protein